MIVIDDVDAFVGDSHSRPDLADDATLSRLMLLLTLATAVRAPPGPRDAGAPGDGARVVRGDIWRWS